MVAGTNYGQGSSREHAAITPRYLGLRIVLAVSFARIHWQNLANFGVLALEFSDPEDYERVKQDDVLVVDDLRYAGAAGPSITIRNTTRGDEYLTGHRLSARQVSMVLAGGMIPSRRNQEPPTHR